MLTAPDGRGKAGPTAGITRGPGGGGPHCRGSHVAQGRAGPTAGDHTWPRGGRAPLQGITRGPGEGGAHCRGSHVAQGRADLHCRESHVAHAVPLTGTGAGVCSGRRITVHTVHGPVG